jgi:membrane-bound lytic murein transglycosylase D
MTKIIFSASLLMFCCVATSAGAATSGVEDATWTQVASFTSEKSSARSKEARRGGVNLAPVDERSLSSALELPAVDAFVSNEPSDGFDEFELKIPDYVLPESDIPLTVNSKVEYFINFFQTNGRSWFSKWLSRSERYIPMMKEVLKKEGLPEDLVYLAMIESGFSTHARSRASAVGPWQFIAGTGKRYSLRIDPWIDERRDPLKSTIAAAMYLKELYSLFNKDWYLAAAGYNAGENKILRAISMYESRDFWQLSRGDYLKRETKDYVPKLLAAAIIAKEPAKYGFADVAYLPPIEFDTVTIPTRTDLEVVAKAIDAPYETIRELNPELKKWCTPPDYPDYSLKIPKGKKAVFLREYAQIPENQRYTERSVSIRYRAVKGDTLESIARRFGVSAEEIASLNNLRNTRKLRGRLLRVVVKPEPRQTEIAAKPQVVAAENKADIVRKDESVKKAPPREVAHYYTVRRGDTLKSVAKRFNVSTRIIAAWNNIKGKMALKPGKRIIVAKFVEKGGKMTSLEKENG